MNNITVDFSSVILPGTEIPLYNGTLTLIAGSDPIAVALRDFSTLFLSLMFFVYLIFFIRRIVGSQR